MLSASLLIASSRLLDVCYSISKTNFDFSTSTVSYKSLITFLSFNLAIVLPRWNTYCVNCGTQGVSPRTPSIHRLQRGLPGYLILFAPHAFAPHRQLPSSNPPSPLVFFLISTHFTATQGIPITSPALKTYSFKCSFRVKP